MDPIQNQANPRDMQQNLPVPDPDMTGSMPAAMPADLSAQQPLAQPMPQSQASNSLSADSPAIADDVDLIEKEWVLKAKGIVARTKDDPSAQSKDMNRFKADYLKTRYNKDVKVSET